MRAHDLTRRCTAVAVLVLALLAAGCAGDDDGAAGSSTTEVQQVSFDPRMPDEVAPPPAEGDGITLPQPAPKLPEDYVLEEYLVGGTATSFDAVDTPEDGRWIAEPGEEAE
jgi:ABC-type glycerol-3-phosphate transport system substrate-binding protein